MPRLLWISVKVAGKWTMFYNSFLIEVLIFEIWVVDCLMNMDQKFLFWRVLMMFMYLELIGKEFGFVLWWFGSHERQFYKNFEVLQNLRLVTIFVFNDHFEFNNQCWVKWPFWVQWSLLSLVTNFESSD